MNILICDFCLLFNVPLSWKAISLSFCEAAFMLKCICILIYVYIGRERINRRCNSNSKKNHCKIIITYKYITIVYFLLLDFFFKRIVCSILLSFALWHVVIIVELFFFVFSRFVIVMMFTFTLTRFMSSIDIR